PPGLPAVLGYSMIGIWLSIGAPALFRRLGLAGEGAFGRRVDARMHGYMRHYMATALVVLLLVAGSTLYVRSAVPMGTRPAVLPEADVLVIGHRGAAGLAPENTVPSIAAALEDRKSTRLNSSHVKISYAVFCLKKKKNKAASNLQ